MSNTYVFDLDGTLVDTAPDLRTAINLLMAREGRRAIAPAEMPHLIGNGVRKLIERAFALTGAPLDPTRLDPLYADYLDFYAAHQSDESRPYPGVADTLAALQAAGARLGVLTNKPHDAAVRMIADLGLARFFPVISGGGRRDYLKPDARLFAEVRRELGGDGPAVMIGDSITDVETGHNADAPVVVVSYGYSPTPANRLGADAVVDRFSEVPEAAERLMALFPNGRFGGRKR